MKKLLKWGLIVFVGLIVLGMIGKYGGSTTQNPSPTPTQAVVQEQKATETPVAKYFDLPALIGKNVDEVVVALKDYQKKTLQPTQEQIKLGVKDWDMEFEKDGKDLLVSYVIATKAVNNFFISTDDPSGATQDKKHLLELGTLSENDSRYTVAFVKALRDNSKFTGVKMTPK